MNSGLDMARFPRRALAQLPTPLDATGIAVGESVRIFVKRDDCTGLAMGGNKARKLEFAIGDALARGATLLITSGARHSNHVRQTAAAAARAGLRCQVVLHDPVERESQFYTASGNILLTRLFGADVHFVADENEATDVRVGQLERAARAAGETPVVIMPGASDGTGALGYANCAGELLAQFEAQNIAPSAILLATGSGGTQAGLLGGLRLLGSNIPVIGISISEPAPVKCAKIRTVLDQMLAKLGSALTIPDSEILVFDDYSGAGYAIPTSAAQDAIQLASQREGLLLDPVYTGKAMAGLFDLAHRGLLNGDVVFLHTGGTPALFAYTDAFLDADLVPEVALSC